MILPTRRFRQTCWLALWAVLMFTLAPTIAKLQAAGLESNRIVSLCTAAGAVSIALDDSTALSVDGSSDHESDRGEHCAYCSLLSHASLAGPPADANLKVAVTVHRVPRLFLIVASTPHIWAPQRARGPPAFA